MKRAVMRHALAQRYTPKKMEANAQRRTKVTKVNSTANVSSVSPL
jgi:hypothetical protein